jgi:hypothetical protein
MDRTQAISLREQGIEEGIVLHPGQAKEGVDAMGDQTLDYDLSG